jgi:GMP synthase-like glutamine amidotransferase
MIRLHYLQHEPDEGPAYVATYAKARWWRVSRTALYTDNRFPPMAEFDALVIMGGSMNVYEEDKYPWLAAEKKFIADAIAARKKIVGICLGAQLIADVLGAKVTRNRYKEIGWFPINFTPQASTLPVLRSIPESMTVFHWHGDTFGIPQGAVHIAQSEGCANQGFVYGDRVVALQFHIESDAESIAKMVATFDEKAEGSPFVQTIERISTLSGQVMEKAHQALETLLDNLSEKE